MKNKNEQPKKVRAKYDKIFNACLLDKSTDVDVHLSSVERAVRHTCNSIAVDRSWFERLQYD